MCQMNIILAKPEGEEVLLEGASLLEVTADGIEISTLFDAPRLIEKARVKKIDFLGGRVTLEQTGEGAKG